VYSFLEVIEVINPTVPCRAMLSSQPLALCFAKAEVIVEVKSYKFGNPSTKKSGYTMTRKWRLMGACVYLEKVNAKRRILALTDKGLCSQFKKDAQSLFRTVDIRLFKIA
jgi:hypothetical protein